jgi:hypothetical protein
VDEKYLPVGGRMSENVARSGRPFSPYSREKIEKRWNVWREKTSGTFSASPHCEAGTHQTGTLDRFMIGLTAWSTFLHDSRIV